MNGDEITLSMTLIVSITVMLIAIATFASTFFFNSKKKNKEDVEGEISVRVSLERMASNYDSMGRDMRDMKNDLSRFDKRVDNLVERMVKSEERITTIFTYIDSFRNDIENLKGKQK